MSVSPQWREVEVQGHVTFEVPPDAREQELQPVDSVVGLLRGEGYEVLYDYGRFAESLSDYEEEPAFGRCSLPVHGRSGTAVSFHPVEEPWDTVRILQVRDGRNVLTIRVSCEDAGTCEVADAIFGSVAFG